MVSESRCLAIHYEQRRSEETSISEINLSKFKFDKEPYKVMKKFEDLMAKLGSLDLDPLDLTLRRS